MIRTQNLQYAYTPGQLMAFPDLVCEAGQHLLVTGASGSGKTTLLHLLAGLLRPTQGQIIIDQTDLAQLSHRALDRFRGQHIGLVLQSSHFVSSISVLENLELASWLATKQKQRGRALDLLRQLDMTNQANKLPAQLSLGQQQRLSIARALMNNPRLLLADEPTSSLDDTNAEAVAQLLQQLAAEQQSALVIVTHDQRLKEQFAQQLHLNPMSNPQNQTL